MRAIVRHAPKDICLDGRSKPMAGRLRRRSCRWMHTANEANFTDTIDHPVPVRPGDLDVTEMRAPQLHRLATVGETR